MRDGHVPGLLLLCLAANPVFAGRPVFSEFSVPEAAARAQVIVQGVLVQEERVSECEVYWRVRVIDTPRVASAVAPALRPVPGKAIAITNLGMAGRADCEVRRATRGGGGASFPADRVAGGAEAWKAFLRKEPVFLMLVAEGAGHFRFVMDSSLTLDAGQLPLEDKSGRVKDAWFVEDCAPFDGPATRFILDLKDEHRIHLVVYQAESRVGGAYQLTSAQRAGAASGLICGAARNDCTPLTGRFEVRLTKGSALLSEVAVGQPGGLTLVAKNLRLRHVPDRPICGG